MLYLCPDDHWLVYQTLSNSLSVCIYSDVCEEVPDDPEPLISTIHKTTEKIRKRGDLKKETIK